MKTSFWARFTQIVGAWGFWTIYGYAYDDLLYPLAIFKWGAVVGGGTMAILASLQCVLWLLWYEWMGKDWLGVNVVEDIKKDGGGWVEKLDAKLKKSILLFPLRIVSYPFSKTFLLVLWAIKKSDLLAFVTLNIVQDPFITTVFLRHGRFNGLRKKDWFVFCASLVFSNGYWIARNVVFIEIIKFGWHHLIKS
ncbi:TPA: hypothetical protein DCQ44_03520 [Candidatus Taylorbacteria bacterium]|nr:hypothetical protein [Candidatus Taylorbacteria bacterium]